MRDSDTHPVEAFAAGFQSGLARLALVWLTLSLGIGIPFLPLLGMETLKTAILWPLGVVYGVVSWATLPSILPAGAVLIPVAMIVSAWAFIQQFRPGMALWTLFTLSLLLNAPLLAEQDNWRWPAAVGGGWALLTGFCFFIGRRHGASD